MKHFWTVALTIGVCVSTLNCSPAFNAPCTNAALCSGSSTPPPTTAASFTASEHTLFMEAIAMNVGDIRLRLPNPSAATGEDVLRAALQVESIDAATKARISDYLKVLASVSSPPMPLQALVATEVAAAKTRLHDAARAGINDAIEVAIKSGQSAEAKWT